MKKKVRKETKTEVDDNTQNQLHRAAPRPNANTWHLHTPRDNSYDDPYNTPSNKRFLSFYNLSDSPQSSTYIKQERSRSATEVAEASLPSETTDPASDDISATKLKGTVYPGMSIFDAATEEQRRKRNQKKLPSVLQNMVLTSESVEQYECIWDEDMSGVTRTRNVYDSPSIDGSPVSELLNLFLYEAIKILKTAALQDDKDNPPSTGNKRHGRRTVVTSPAPRRQTRASARVASAKVGKRRPAGPRKATLKVDEDLVSDDGSNRLLRAPSRCVFDGEVDAISMEDDVFQERRPPGQGKSSSSFSLFSA